MDEQGLQQEVSTLRRELERLNSHKMLQLYGSTRRLLWHQFLRGLAFGLGSVMGATILVSVLVYVLSFVDFVPVLGEWAAEVVRIVEGAQ